MFWRFLASCYIVVQFLQPFQEKLECGLSGNEVYKRYWNRDRCSWGSKRQGLKIWWEDHTFQTLVEVMSERQSLQATSVPTCSKGISIPSFDIFWYLLNLLCKSIQYNSDKLLGKGSPSTGWLKQKPKLKCCRCFGHFRHAMLWSKQYPNAKLRRESGRSTPAKLWSKSQPKVKLTRRFGNVTRSKSWLKCTPKVRDRRFSGRRSKSKFWLKLSPNVRCSTPLGSFK